MRLMIDHKLCVTCFIMAMIPVVLDEILFAYKG